MRRWIFIVNVIIALVWLVPTCVASACGMENDVCLPVVTTPRQTTFYVSPAGNNNNGLTWASAWSDLDQIDWQSIQPGDTIYLDGGDSQMVYTSSLKPERSGTAANPIKVRLSQEAGRNGKAIIFGGRTTQLPYCGQKDYVYESEGVRSYGMFFEEDSWLIIDGTKWSGITIYGHKRNALRFQSTTDHITIRNVEAYDNGFAESRDSGWQPNAAGVRVAGQHHVFERMIVHDNGADAFQSAAGDGGSSYNNLDNLTIRQSWLYNGRSHPSVPESYNYCIHTDGLQIYTGGNVSNVLIEESIIGPGFTNGIILGQTLTAGGAEAVVNDVTLRHVLFSKTADNGIVGYSGTKPDGWVFDHVTEHCPMTKGHCLTLAGSNHAVTNSIVVGASIRLPDGLDKAANNCQWDTAGYDIGKTADPKFVDVNDQDPFSLDDYSLASASPCVGRGTSITSVTELMNLPDYGDQGK